MPSFVSDQNTSPPWRRQGAANGGLGLPPASTEPAAAAAPAQQSAAADPSYLAYLRGVGAQEAELGNILAQRQGALVRQLGRALPAYADKRAESIEAVGRSAESRGMYRSGARIRDQFRAGRDVDRERMNFEADIRDRLAELNATNALDIVRLRQALADQGINSAQGVDIASAQAGL